MTPPAIKTASEPAITEFTTAGPANCAIGVSAVFIETHENPDCAPSDGPNMIPIEQMKELIGVLRAFDDLAKGK